MPSFTIGSINIIIEDLSPEIDQVFQKLYASRLGKVQFSEAEFDEKAITFLMNTTDPDVHDKYFNNFTPLWKLLLHNGHFQEAESVWEWALRPVLALEEQSTHRIHKGTAYYFWGMTALLERNLDAGYLLMHRGLEEDVLTHGTVTPQTPGFAFVTLDHERQEQAFRPWVQYQAGTVQKRLARFVASYGRPFDLGMLRTRFLSQAAQRKPAFLYSYAIARTNKLINLPDHLWVGPFPGQVAFDVIFDLCLVADEALHYKNPGGNSFIDHGTYLSQRTGLRMSRDDLRAINDMFKNNFAQTLQSGLADQLTLPDGRALSPLACSLAVAYGCRNRGAHTVAAVPLDKQQFDDIVGRICDILFLTVSTLY